MNKNALVLAYLGDSIYETYIRMFLIEQGFTKVKKLQEESIKYVSATSQAKYLKQMLDDNILTNEELNIVYNARNHKCNHRPKHTDIITYKYATGLEALIGYLYYQNNNARISEIIKYVIGR